MAVRLFMHPDSVMQIPNISYYHISHQNKIASSFPGAEVAIPQVFRDEGRRWTDDPALSDLALVMKKPPGAALSVPTSANPTVSRGSAIPSPLSKSSEFGGKKMENMLQGGKPRHGKRSPSTDHHRRHY
jgi:hypothetical protein